MASDAERLRAAGFIDEEVKEFMAHPSSPTDSPLWDDAIERRIVWIQDKLDRGWDKPSIKGAIQEYYKRGANRTPWDFLKREYLDPKRVDYVSATKKAAIQKTDKFFNV